jgi:hypothetical protein
MQFKKIIYTFLILAFIGYSQNYLNPYYSGSVYAQDDTPAQKNQKKQKKKRMKEQVKTDQAALNRHMDIQSKATRKRMKKHLKDTERNIKRSHR